MTVSNSSKRSARLPDGLRMEIGRIMHEKTMRLQEVVAKYGIGESVAYKAQQAYRVQSGLPTHSPTTRTYRKAAALYAPPSPRDESVTDDLKAENLELQHQLQSAHEEIMVLQKILMVVGRTL